MRNPSIILCLAALASGSNHKPVAAQVIQAERFDANPSWDGFRHFLVPKQPRITRQKFGWTSTNHAGGVRPGEIGGQVHRSLTAASYAFALPNELTLDDRLEASGTLAVTEDNGSSGVLIGWFHKSSRGWRTNNSLAFRIDGNSNKYWLFFEYGTRSRLTGGKGVFEGDRYQETPTNPFKADGTVHRWRISYNPRGGGKIIFRVDDQSHEVKLTKEARADGARFDRFGIWNQQATGGSLTFWIDDLKVNGKRFGFDDNPHWMEIGNRVAFQEGIVRPFHRYGFSPTNNAGGRPGEMGGIIWRDEQPSYYATKTRRLTLDNELFASGRLTFRSAGVDSGVYIGWFNSALKRTNSIPEYEQRQPSYVGILLEGPSRVGHFFRPGYATRKRHGFNAESGPVLNPSDRVHSWSIHYQPDGADGRGRIRTTLNGDSQTVDLHPGHRMDGATFDRFGLFNMQSGGWHVELYIDEIEMRF